ncbi:transcription termination/antitermination factor NusG [Candidatus Roizmanbacteria bacterium]|nr:transcription termination/antitermination factor NusG [Candidatus Roizmanbacteria bacterium]
MQADQTLREQQIVKEQKEAVSTKPGPVSPQAKWYVIHIQTGYEGRVKRALEQRVKSLGVEDKIFDVVIPMRDIVVVKKGKKTKTTEKVFPGYILVRMILDDDSWLVVRTTEGVTGFVGAGLKPTPISDKEVDAIMKFVQQEQPKFKTKFSVGEAVKITEGPFADFLGTIEAIDEGRGKVRVLVSIFDRETPVELDFLQVAKL